MHSLAASYKKAGQQEKSLPLREEVFELMKAKLGEDHSDTLVSMNNLVQGYKLAGQAEKSLPLQEKSFALMKAKLGEDHPHTGRAAGLLGFAYADGRNPEKAIVVWQEAVRIDPSQTKVQYCLGKALADRGRHGEALPPLRAAHDLIPAGDPEHAQNLERLRTTLVALGRDEEAKDLPAAEGDDGDPDAPPADVVGTWVDVNGGSIKIEQDGVKVLAVGQNEKVTKYWTKGVGELKGRALTMTHYLGEKRTDVQRGIVSEDGSRIDWANGSHWKREGE